MTTGRYLLLDRVGVGGMAEVFRAKSFGPEGGETIVAIKRIRPHLAQHEGFVQMFEDEATIAGQLEHENVVRIYEVGKLEGTHFIAMEYVFGRDLLQLLAKLRSQQQVMAPQMAAWITANMLAGLHYAHTRVDAHGRPLALVHRDISPQNVLISYDGAVKLIDFGIAKATTRVFQTMGDVVKGKIGYMSPQQILGEPIDHRSDIFAASTCLHEMLTCRRLFRGPSDVDVVDRVRNAWVDPPSATNARVSPELDAIVMRGLAREPHERWQSAAEMRDALMMYVATSDPPFAAPQLGFVMRALFDAEMRAEWAQLNHLGHVDAPGVRIGEAPAPAAPEAPDFTAGDTLVTELPPEAFQSGEVSRLVSVDAIVAVGVPTPPTTSPSEPFMLVSQPPPQPAAPPPEELLPDSTMAFPLVVQPGTFDPVDTSEDFARPFHGAVRLAGAPMPRVLAPGESIPDLPVVVSPPDPPTTPPSRRPKAPPKPAAGGTPWLLLGLTALVALLLGALGVLVALFLAGVLPPH
ncbi:MAG: serine/threonine protein kinase [Sandaracinaceae bacterium]|nr:serine/threonine protein kinase [Sandaracinaceae bacterium]